MASRGASAARPLIGGLYQLKRRYGIGDRFLSRHPRVADALMSLLGPVKQRSVVDVHGHVLEVDEDDYLGLTITRIYEPEVTRFLQLHVRSGHVAVDVGANIGYFTLLLARLVGPEGRVIAFEPDAENFRLLDANVRANGFGNVELRRRAVSDRSGSALLYRSSVNPGDHRLAETEGREAVEVETVALDDVALEGELDWLKIDVQGAELAVLRGMRSVLESSTRVTIVLELAPAALREFGADPEELVSLMLESGFAPFAPQWDGSIEPISALELLHRARNVEATYTNVVFAGPSSPVLGPQSPTA